MLASVGMPEGGIAQPASGAKLRSARAVAMNRERMSLDRMAFPLLNRRLGREGVHGLANWMGRCQQALPGRAWPPVDGPLAAMDQRDNQLRKIRNQVKLVP